MNKLPSPVPDGIASDLIEVVDGMPISRELLRHRREWAKFMEEQPPAALDAAAGPQQESRPVGEPGPERLIGPRSPDHPQVNRKSGGRNPG